MIRKLLAVLALLLAAPAGAAPSGAAPVYIPDAIASGTLGALNASFTLNLAGENGVTLVIPATSTLIATLTPYCSSDLGTTFTATAFYPDYSGSTQATLTTASGTAYQYGVALLSGCRQVKVQATAYTSGTVSASLVGAQYGLVGNGISGTGSAGTSAPGVVSIQGIAGMTPVQVIGTVANNAAAGNGLQVWPGIYRTASPAYSSAGQVVAPSVDATGALFFNVGTLTLSAGILAVNSAPPAAGLTTIGFAYRTSSPGFSTNGYGEVPTLDAAGSLNVVLGDVGTTAQIAAANGAAAGNGVADLPGIVRSAITAGTAGRTTAEAIDSTTGFQVFSLGDASTYTKAAVVANDATAVANGVETQPSVARAAPTALGAAGRSEKLQSDLNTGALFVEVVPTTSSAGFTFGSFAANTAANLKASAGSLYGAAATQSGSSVCWLQFYNSSSAPTCGTSVVFAIPVPATAGLTYAAPDAIQLFNFSSGIGICCSTTPTGGTTCGGTCSGVVYYK